MGNADEAYPAFLNRVVEFPTEGTSYELLKPLTNFRKCHDGSPAEGRILFTCRQSSSSQQNSEDEFVIKIKVQYSGQGPEAGPSSTASAELKALEAFSKDSNPYTPHLVSWKQEIQGSAGLLPGGYITYTVMTKMPGEHLLNRYWNLPANERENVVQEFLPALRSEPAPPYGEHILIQDPANHEQVNFSSRHRTNRPCFAEHHVGSGNQEVHDHRL